jgi:hypothetical protein
VVVRLLSARYWLGERILGGNNDDLGIRRGSKDVGSGVDFREIVAVVTIILAELSPDTETESTGSVVPVAEPDTVAVAVLIVAAAGVVAVAQTVIVVGKGSMKDDPSLDY